MADVFLLLFKLLIGHAISDFTFQSGDMAKGKNRNRPPDNVPPGQTPMCVWPYWLTAHALIHGGTVWAITGQWELGLIEAALHWWIDFAKCANWTVIHTDQALHVACKIGYVIWLT